MDEFDFFGVNEQPEEFAGSSELELSADFDYENLLNDGSEKEIKLCISVKPSDELRRSFEECKGNQGTHICLLIDASDSMITVIGGDVKRTGEKTIGEDGKTYNIVTGMAITPFKIAIKSAKRVVELMREDDTLSCIAYSDHAQLLFHDLKARDSKKILDHLDRIKVGMYTNISEALILANATLSQYTDTLPKRALLFTDGTPTGGDTEKKGILAGQKLAANNITIDSMGIGDLKTGKSEDINYSFLQKISSFSGGCATLIEYPDQFASVFTSIFKRSQSVIITNAKLVLQLPKMGVELCDYYRCVPDNVYLGKAKKQDRTLELSLGQIEHNQEYKYCFEIKLSGVNGYEGAFNIMNAELHFFAPGRYDDKKQITKIDVPIYYTSDMDEADEINGDVDILFKRAKVKKLEEERQKAYKGKNIKETQKRIREIIEIYQELQDEVNITLYANMLAEYENSNQISMTTVNRATSSSSQAQETGILDPLTDDEMDFFAKKLRNRNRH